MANYSVALDIFANDIHDAIVDHVDEEDDDEKDDDAEEDDEEDDDKKDDAE